MLTSSRGVCGYLVATRASLVIASVHCSQADGATQSERRARRRESERAKAGGHMYVVSESQAHERRRTFAVSATTLAAPPCGRSRPTPPPCVRLHM